MDCPKNNPCKNGCPNPLRIGKIHSKTYLSTDGEFQYSEINVKLNNMLIIKQHGTKSNQKCLERNPGNK